MSRSSSASQSSRVSSLQVSNLSGPRFSGGVISSGGGGGGSEFTIVYTVGPYGYNDFTDVSGAISKAQTEATSENPILIHIEPGEYSGFLLSAENIHIQGSGQEVTRIITPVTIFSNSAILSDLDFQAEISWISIEMSLKDCLVSANIISFIGEPSIVHFDNTTFTEESQVILSKTEARVNNCSGLYLVNDISGRPELLLGGYVNLHSTNSSIRGLILSLNSQPSTINLQNCTVSEISIEPNIEPDVNHKINVENCIFKDTVEFNNASEFKVCSLLGGFTASSLKADVDIIGCAISGTIDLNSESEKSVSLLCTSFENIQNGENVECSLISCHQVTSTPAIVTYGALNITSGIFYGLIENLSTNEIKICNITASIFDSLTVKLKKACNINSCYFDLLSIILDNILDVFIQINCAHNYFKSPVYTNTNTVYSFFTVVFGYTRQQILMDFEDIILAAVLMYGRYTGTLIVGSPLYLQYF